MALTHVYDHYYRYGEIEEILKGYAEKYPRYAALSSAGQTPEKRQQWVLTVTDTETGSAGDKPALYVEGNIHAGEVTGSMTVMYLLDSIFSNLEKPEIKNLLENYTLYAMPRVSPDGSEFYLTNADSLRSAPRMFPLPELVPGLQRKDMDGDGVIRLMRVKSPYGAWKVSDKDGRVMTARRPDELEGEFYDVFDEGYMEGPYDGLDIKAAPQPFGNDFNRNYPIGWETEDSQKGSGDYPLSNPETRSNADFLLNHPNVCCVIDMHTSGGQNLYTPGYKSQKDAIKQDIDLYRMIGEIAHEENGYPVLNLYDQYMPASHPRTSGGFDDFCHFTLGVPAMTIECWDLMERAGVKATYPPREDKTDSEREQELCLALKWLDENVGKEAFKPWTEFDHPQLGRVEIGGGDVKFLFQNPPVPYLEQELKKHTAFMLRLIKMLPRLRLENISTKKVSEGVFEVSAECANIGYMPTYVFKEALKIKRLRGISVSVSGVETIGGSEISLGHLEGRMAKKAQSRGITMSTELAGDMRKKVAFIVKGKEGDSFELTCQSPRGGSFTVRGVL